MKRMLIYIMLSTLLAVAGCRSAEPFDNITRAASPTAFNYVTATNGARIGASVYDDVSYYIVFDDENRTANITISNLNTPGRDEPLTLTFKDCEMTYTANNHSKERIVKADVLVSNSPVGSGVVITNATFVYTESNKLDPNGIDGIYARFTIDDVYTVTAYPYHIFADGTTRIDNLSDGSSTIDYVPVYAIDINPDAMTASLKICNLTLNGAAKEISISPLRFVLTENGYGLEMTSETKFKISGADNDEAIGLESISAEAILLDELKIDMRLNVEGTVMDVAAFLTSNLSKTVY